MPCGTFDIHDFGSLAEQKVFLRKRARSALKEFCADSELMKECSRSAFKAVIDTPEYEKAPVILGYMAMKDELDLSPILEKAISDGKKVALPRMRRSLGDEPADFSKKSGSFCGGISDSESFTGGVFASADDFRKKHSSENSDFRIFEKFSDFVRGSDSDSGVSSVPDSDLKNADRRFSSDSDFRSDSASKNAVRCFPSDSEKNVMDFFYVESLSDALDDKNCFSIKEPHENLEMFEPLSLPENALVFVPGLAFNLEGARLGRGKGYYDRFLANLPAGRNLTLCGCCFTICVTKDIPIDENDFFVNHLLTEYGFVSVKRM